MRYHKLMQNSGQNNKVILGILIFLVVGLAGLSGWAIWQYIEERDTVEQQIEVAVDEALGEQREELEEEFEQELRNPFRTYSPPDVFGAIDIKLPKNWNIYVEEDEGGNLPVDLYIHPELVRDFDGELGPVAFRMQLVDELYDQATRNVRRDVDRGELDASTTEVSGIEGDRYEGVVRDDYVGVKVSLPYRDKTILMWTESESYLDDFEEMLEESSISR